MGKKLDIVLFEQSPPKIILLISTIMDPLLDFSLWQCIINALKLKYP